jgi:hypothetical protein
MGQRIIGACAAAALFLLWGCMEGEKFTYKSTPHVPQTVTILNTSTGEQVWTYDVPAGKELTIHFLNRPSRTNELGYDEMTWTVGPAGEMPPAPTNRMRVPPPDSRRIDVSVRPGPELPSGEQARQQRKAAANSATTPSAVVTPDGKQASPTK